jgi:hypothetical protein
MQMKLFFLLAVFFLTASNNLMAQKKAKAKTPVKKTASKSKTAKKKTGTKIKTSTDDELDIFMCFEGGGPCTFTILKGDTLIYTVNQNSTSYDMYIVANKFTANALADYNWYTTETQARKGKIQINALGLTKGNKYLFNYTSGDTKLNDASTIWLSEKSYKEIAAGTGSKISIDNGAEETFKSPEVDESNVTITYKGNQVSLEGFAIQNKSVGEAGRKELSYLNISDNLLLLKADLEGSSIVLKEVRASKTR